MYKNLTLFSILIFSFMLTCSGQNGLIHILRGTVRNAATGEPLSYATVSLLKKV